MNTKAIFSVLVVLCAIQASNGGFIGSLIGSIIGTLFNGLFGFVISVTVGIISFTSTTLLFVSQITFQVLAVVHFGIFQIISRNNNTLFGLSNATANLVSQIQNSSANISSQSSFLGYFAINSLTDSITDLSFTLNGMAHTLAGRRPHYTPPRSSFFDDFFYLTSIFECIPDSNSTSNSTNATIACQAIAFNYYADLHIKNLERAAKWYEKTNNHLDANCSTVNTTTVQNVTENFASLMAAINAFINVTVVNGTLMAQVNATFGVNITLAMNETQNLIESISNSTSCLVAAASKNRKRRLSKVRDFVDFALIGSWHHRSHRRFSFFKSMNGLFSFRSNSGSLISQLFNACGSIQSALAGYVNLKVQNFHNKGKDFYNILLLFAAKSNSTSSIIAEAINTTINGTECNKSSIISNASSVVNETLTNLISTIIAQNSSECSELHLNISAGFFANFTTDVQSCGDAAADDAHDAQYANITGLLANLTAAFNYNTNITSNCYSTYCSGNSASNSYSNAGVNCIQDNTFLTTTGGLYLAGIWIIQPVYGVSAKGLNFISCYNTIIANVTAIYNSVDATLSALLTNFGTNVNNITSTYASCVESKTSFVLSAFAEISANFTSCTQQTTTTSSDTTTTVAAT